MTQAGSMKFSERLRRGASHQIQTTAGAQVEGHIAVGRDRR